MIKRKKISSSVAHTNPWFQIVEDGVIRPDGTKGKYFHIKRNDSVVVIPTSKGKIFLLNVFRYPLGSRSWELPMGMSESSNYLLQAKKELREETGITAKDWTRVGKFSWISGLSGQMGHVFLAKDLSFEKPKREPEELDMKMKAFSFLEVDNMIKSSRIIDDGTITAIYLAKLKGFLK